jgi:hypothetical protein
MMRSLEGIENVEDKGFICRFAQASVLHMLWTNVSVQYFHSITSFFESFFFLLLRLSSTQLWKNFEAYKAHQTSNNVV